MIDVDRLNDTIEDLEGQVINIKKVAYLIDKLEELKDDVEINKESQNVVITDINKTKLEISDLIKDYKINTINSNKHLIEIDNKIIDRMDCIDKKNEKFYNEITTINNSLRKEVMDTKNMLDLRIKDTILEIQ